MECHKPSKWLWIKRAVGFRSDLVRHSLFFFAYDGWRNSNLHLLQPVLGYGKLLHI
jgi:hypothetical protein